MNILRIYVLLGNDMEVSRVSKKGLTNIPAKIRKALDIEEGDLFEWRIDKKQNMIVIKVIKNPAKYLKGKYDDINLVYDKVEELADRLVMRELHATNRA